VLRQHVERLERCLFAYDEMTLPDQDADRIAKIKAEIDYHNIVNDLESIMSDCHLGAERIRDVVQNLRLFSRLDESEIKQVDLNESIEATVRLLSRYYKSGRISLWRDYGELPLVNCYAAQLNQVWMNLLVNAAQAIEDDGTVRIQTISNGKPSASQSLIPVKASLPRILKRFSIRSSRPSRGRGNWPGPFNLSRHRRKTPGTIAVDNIPGDGTTFTITLPVDIEETEALEN